MVTMSTTPPGGSINSIQFNDGSGGFGGGNAWTDGNNIAINNTQGYRFNGSGDANWQIGRNLSTLVFPWLSPQISTNTLEFICGNGSGEGFVFGNNGGTHYFELDSNGNAWFANNLNALGILSASNFSGSSSGTNTGDQTITLSGAISGTGTESIITSLIATSNSTLVTLSALSLPYSQISGAPAAITALTGDGTANGPGSVVLTLTTVNSSIGTFGSSTSIPTFTVNAKGLITAASGNPVIAPAGTLTGTTLNSTVVSSSLTSLGIQAQALNLGGNQVNDAANPTSPQDVATKYYVDQSIAGLTWKGPVNAYTPSNVTLTGGATLTIDGYSVQNGDYVLLANQTTASQNGVYVVSGIGTAYTLTLLTNSEATTALGDAYLVLNGTVYGNTAFEANQLTPYITYIQFAGPTIYSFSAPLVLTGSTVSITLATTSTNGYLSSTDWNTFNNKQPAGSYITALAGDVTASGPGSATTSLVATSNSTLTTLSALTTASSLSTVGTITSGTWHAGVIGISYGGTNNSTPYTAGSIIFSNGTSLTQDNAYLYWDDTDKALGVGITAVSTIALNLYGQTANQNIIFQVSDPSTGVMTFGNFNTGGGGNPMLTITSGASSGATTCGSIALTGNGYGGAVYLQGSQNDGGYQACALTMDGDDHFVLYHMNDNLVGHISKPLQISVQSPNYAISVNYQGYTAFGMGTPSYQVDINGTCRATNIIDTGLTVSSPVFTNASNQLVSTGTVPVANGGTSVASFTAYMPIVGGTTTTSPLQSVSTSGAAAGYVLTYVSGSAIPTWQANGGTPVTLTVSGGSANLNTALGNTFYLTMTGATTINAPTNPSDGQKIVIAATSSGGSYQLTLATTGTNPFLFGTTLTSLNPTASGTTDYIGAIYNATIGNWLVVSYSQGF
jgi:hypothetical protein